MLRPGDYRQLRITVAADEIHGTEIIYDPAKGTILVDRTRSGGAQDICNTREFRVSGRDGAIELRMLLDRYSLELFVNGGEQAASFTIYTPGSAEDIRFAAEGSIVLDAVQYDLEL